MPSLQALAKHKRIAHFELRPLDRTGNSWQLSYRDISTVPPAYSGAVRGTLDDVVVQALDRVNAVEAPTPPTQPRQKRMTRR